MDPNLNPNFYTSIHLYNQNELWNFFFEQGWRNDGENYYTAQCSSLAKKLNSGYEKIIGLKYI